MWPVGRGVLGASKAEKTEKYLNIDGKKTYTSKNVNVEPMPITLTREVENCGFKASLGS